MTIHITERDGDVQFRIRVSAGAKTSGINGIHDGMLKVSVTTVPEKGKANKAIIDLLARLLHLKKTQIVIAAGSTSTTKTIRVHEINQLDLTQRIDRATPD